MADSLWKSYQHAKIHAAGKCPQCPYCSSDCTIRARGTWERECVMCDRFFRSEWHVLRAFRCAWNAAAVIAIGLAVGMMEVHPLAGLIAAPFLTAAVRSGVELWSVRYGK